MERMLEMLKAIHGGKTIEQLAEEFDVSTTTIDNWRVKLRDGISFLGARIKVDFGRGGRMDTTVHPLFLPANSSEVFALLVILLRYARHPDDIVFGMVAEDLAGQIYYQLSDYARALIGPALTASGLRAPYAVQPVFLRDDQGGRDPMYLITLQKRDAHIEVVFDSMSGRKKIRGRFSHKPARRPNEARECIVVKKDEGGEEYIEFDKILVMTELPN